MNKSIFHMFSAIVCTYLAIIQGAISVDDDHLKDTTKGTLSWSAANDTHSANGSRKLHGGEFSQANDPEKSGKLFCKVTESDYAQLSLSCQSIYEDRIPCQSVNKLTSIRIDLHNKSVANAKKTVIDVIQQWSYSGKLCMA